MNEFFHSTESLLIVHKVRVDEEIQRSHPEHNLRFRAVGRHGIVATARRGAGRGLIALGTRLNPTVVSPEHAALALQG